MAHTIYVYFTFRLFNIFIAVYVGDLEAYIKVTLCFHNSINLDENLESLNDVFEDLQDFSLSL